MKDGYTALNVMRPMDKLNLILLIGMVILCTIVLMVYIDTVYGDLFINKSGAQGSQNIITPYHTGNKQYCGFGEHISEKCINIIPQNEPITSIKDVSVNE